VDVVGAGLQSGDFFAHDRKLPPWNQRLIAVLDAGARHGAKLEHNTA